VAAALTSVLAAHPLALLAATCLDFLAGDPVYRAHPVRVIGAALGVLERGLRRMGADGYGGGVMLFLILGGMSLAGTLGLVLAAAAFLPSLGWLLHVFFVYSFLAIGDLVRHVWRVEQAAMRQDVGAARVAIANLVGRDTDRMDIAACRRAAIESLSESLTDGFTSALFWYALAGLPGLVVFKVVSTMDSMVGYKTPRYLRFGWCGARLDDVMNYVPARLTWLLIAVVSLVMPGTSARKAWSVGLGQHAILPGPNSGWSEAATAGAISRRLVGPIWIRGALVTDTWIGDLNDPPAETHDDVARAVRLITTTAVVATVIAAAGIWGLR